jgi:hypothetical protein
MDDNIIVFATMMRVFTISIIYFATCTKRHRPHMANLAILIGLLSFQYTHPLVFFAIIHVFFMIYYLIANTLLEKAIIT